MHGRRRSDSEVAVEAFGAFFIKSYGVTRLGIINPSFRYWVFLVPFYPPNNGQASSVPVAEALLLLFECLSRGLGLREGGKIAPVTGQTDWRNIKEDEREDKTKMRGSR